MKQLQLKSRENLCPESWINCNERDVGKRRRRESSSFLEGRLEGRIINQRELSLSYPAIVASMPSSNDSCHPFSWLIFAQTSPLYLILSSSSAAVSFGIRLKSFPALSSFLSLDSLAESSHVSLFEKSRTNKTLSSSWESLSDMSVKAFLTDVLQESSA